METEKIKQKKTVTKDEIMVAALKLFADKGYFNTSLNDIKDQLQIKTTSGIYQQFPNKQSIAAALYDSIVDSLSVSIDDICRRNRLASQQLREIVDLLFKLTEDAPNVVSFLLLTNVQELLPEAVPLSQSVVGSKIKRIMQSGIKSGEIKAIDAALAYTAFFGIVFNSLTQILQRVLDKSAHHYLPQIWLLAWNSIAKKP